MADDQDKYTYKPGELEIIEDKKPEPAAADKPVETKKVGNVEVHVHRK